MEVTDRVTDSLSFISCVKTIYLRPTYLPTYSLLPVYPPAHLPPLRTHLPIYLLTYPSSDLPLIHLPI